MKCNFSHELLSAYADGELNSEERSLVRNHLANCPDCRAKLVEYRKTGETIQAIVEPNPSADISKSVVTAIQAGNGKERNPWLRLQWVGIPAALVSVILLSLYFTGIFMGPEKVLAKASEAIEKIESYRLKMDILKSSDFTEGEPVVTLHYDQEFASATVYRIIQDNHYGPSVYQEMIVINDSVYFKGGVSTPLTLEQIESRNPENETAEYLNLMTDIETLEDESVNGVQCYHCKGILEAEILWELIEPGLLDTYESWRSIYEDTAAKNAERNENGQSSLVPYDEEIERYLSDARARLENQINILEYWIGKDDFLIRKASMTTTMVGDMYNRRTTSIVYYYDFNADIVITAPLTETGELEEGWYTIDAENFLRTE